MSKREFVGPIQLPQWNDVAGHLDPMMSAEDYEKVRSKYFQDVIIPNVPRGQDLDALYKEFQKRTTRAPLTSPFGQQILKAKVAGTAATKELLASTKPILTDRGRAYLSSLDEQEKGYTKLAERDNISTTIPRVAGTLIGGAIPFAAATTLAEPLAGVVASSMISGATKALRVKGLLEGGLAFATLDAASADAGSRFTAGVKGFGTGLVYTLPIIPFLHAKGFAKSEEEAEKLLEKAIQEPSKVPTPVHQEIAKKLAEESKLIKQEVLPNSIRRNPNVRGILVSLLPKEGSGIQTIEVRPGRENEALLQIRKAMDAGAEFNALHFHPDYEAKAFRFLREARDSELWKYEDSMLIEVKKGLSENLAKKANEEGIPASAPTDSHVEIHVKRIEKDLLPHEKDAKRAEEPDTPKESKAESLPPGVKYLGKQMTGKGEDFVHLYNLKVGEGLETTFTLKEGEDLQEKVDRVRAKWQGHVTVPKMTQERAKQLSQQLGYDPAKVDLEAIQNMGEEELTRLLEIRKRSQGAKQEFDPLGQVEKKEAVALKRVPKRKLRDVQVGETFVDSLLKNGAGQIINKNMKVSLHPFRALIEIPEKIFRRLSPGAQALTYDSFREALSELGVELPEGARGSRRGFYPAVIITKKTTPEEKFHEFIHAGLTKSGLSYKMQTVIPLESRIHAFSISSHLEKGHYEGKDFPNLLNETFAYAATAVRYGNTEYGQNWMRQLTKWDGSEEHIKELVRGTAQNILEASQGKLDSMSERILQRKMIDLVRRADSNISYGIQTAGESARWNPESLNWQIREGNVVYHLKDIYDLWDFLLGKDVSDIGPSFSFGLESLGMRGPMSAVKLSGEPPLPSVGIQPEERWVGASGVSGWFRPFFPWLAKVDSKIGKAIEKRGEAFPIFDKAKAIDNKLREGDSVLQGWRDSFVKAIGGARDKKLHDYFSVLTYSPKDFGQAASKYLLSPKDIENVHNLETWMKNFQDETGVPAFQWLREIYPRLQHYNFAPESVWSAHYDPKSAGLWEKAVRESNFNPKDTHLGRFAGWLMKEGFEKKFTGEPLKDLQKLLDYKVGEKGSEQYFLHKGLRGPLQNYANYVRGIPDQTSVVINRSMKDFVGKVQDKLKVVNSHLPLGMKIPGSEANISPYLLQRMMVLTYAAGLGLRPAIAVRDGLQVLSTSLPILGARRFERGLELMFSSKGRALADKAGAFLGKTNIGELYGDVFGEIPTEGRLAQGLNRFANLMMSPSRWGHNFSRGITFLGEYDNALKAIKDLRAGKLTQDAFMKKTSLWFMDKQVSSKLLIESQSKLPIEEVAKKIGLETVDLTQFPYRRGTQPAILRTGAGRIFGQFGMWPMNYADFLRRVYEKSKGGEYRQQALGTVGLWVASNYAASAGMESLGADVGKWYFLSPAGYSPSMHFDLVKDLAISPEETQAGRDARKRILEYPLNFIPARVELESILKVMEDKPKIGLKQGALDPKVLEVLGFKPAKESPIMTPEEFTQYELGFKRKGPISDR